MKIPYKSRIEKHIRMKNMIYIVKHVFRLDFFFLLDARQYCRLHFFPASLDCVNKMKEKKVRVKKKLLVLPDITIL